jgi:hypothetical protein
MFYGSISYPLSSKALKFDLPAFSASDTKREGIHKFYGSYTTYREPCQPTFCWSIPHQTPIPPQTQTVFLVPSLTCCDQTQQHNSRRNMHLTQVHQGKNAFILFTSYIHAPKAQACLSTQNNKSLLLLLFSILLQHEPSYLSDAAEIQDIAEALSYRAFLFSSQILLCLQNYLILPKTTALSAVWSTSLLSVLSLTLCSILYIAPQKFSPSLQTSDSSSSQGPLLLPEASPKRSVPI